MRKYLFLMICLFFQPLAHAANLVDVYKQAQVCDPVFQQAIFQRLSTKEGLPISIAALLPNIQAAITPTVGRVGYSGSNFDPVMSSSGTYLNPRNLTERGASLNLSLTQTLFDFSQFSQVAQQVSLSKGADATLNAALQNLMVRVSNAYFSILNDEDDLDYAAAAKLAYAEQLDQIKQQFKVGLKTITDVYTAQASYDSAAATYIQAQTTLSNDKENLRVITGVYYSRLDSLSENFPLTTPIPQNVELWVQKAVVQNWSIKASRYNTLYSHEIINQQLAGHFPTVTVETNFSKQITDNIDNYSSFNVRKGPGTTSDRSISLNVNIPLFAGGGVIAQTNQAVYNYQVAQQQLEQTTRSVANTTRQSYLSLTAGVSKIKADKETIKSTLSSLKGLELSYQVGTETLLNVLNQQQKVFDAQRNYARDRYTFINNLLALKQAAGTLSFTDLCILNHWLENKKRQTITKKYLHAPLSS